MAPPLEKGWPIGEGVSQMVGANSSRSSSPDGVKDVLGTLPRSGLVQCA